MARTINLRGTTRPEIFPLGEDAQIPSEGERQISPSITSRYYKQGQSDPYVVQNVQGGVKDKDVSKFYKYPPGDSGEDGVRIRKLTPLE